MISDKPIWAASRKKVHLLVAELSSSARGEDTYASFLPLSQFLQSRNMPLIVEYFVLSDLATSSSLLKVYQSLVNSLKSKEQLLSVVFETYEEITGIVSYTWVSFATGINDTKVGTSKEMKEAITLAIKASTWLSEDEKDTVTHTVLKGMK